MLLGMSTIQSVSYDKTISSENSYPSPVTWFDIRVNKTGTTSPVQTAGTMNDTAIGYAFFTHGDITNTANPTLSSYGDSPDMSLHFYLAIRALLGIIIMTSNGLLLYCICHFPYLHTPTNILVANLSIADFLGGCRQFFAIATVYHIGRSSWADICHVGQVINMLSIVGNMWVMFGISLNSFLYICKPLHYHNWVTIELILKIMAIIWTYSITSSTIAVLKFNRLVIGMPCRIAIILEKTVYYGLYLPQSICIIPGCVLCYTIIAVVAWKQKKRVAPQVAAAETAPDDPNVAASDSTMGAPNWKITKMMTMVPGVYLLSRFPTIVFGIINHRLAHETWVYMDRVVTIMWLTQYWANPLIYAWKNGDFRRAMNTVLQIRSRWIHNHAESDSSDTA